MSGRTTTPEALCKLSVNYIKRTAFQETTHIVSLVAPEEATTSPYNQIFKNFFSETLILFIILSLPFWPQVRTAGTKFNTCDGGAVFPSNFISVVLPMVTPQPGVSFHHPARPAQATDVVCWKRQSHLFPSPMVTFITALLCPPSPFCLFKHLYHCTKDLN